MLSPKAPLQISLIHLRETKKLGFYAFEEYSVAVKNASRVQIKQHLVGHHLMWWTSNIV